MLRDARAFSAQADTSILLLIETILLLHGLTVAEWQVLGYLAQAADRHAPKHPTSGRTRIARGCSGVGGAGAGQRSC